MARDPSLDITFDMAASSGLGTPKVATVLTGTWVSWGHSASPFVVTVGFAPVTGGVSAFGAAAGSVGWNAGQIITASPMQVVLRWGDAVAGVGLTGPVWVGTSSGVGEHAGANWLRWSKVGYLNFTQDRSNVAGQMPLPFKGTIYAILRRGNTVMVYAKNGVAILNPVGVAFGYTVLSNTGLKSKLAVIDTGDAHYYVDSKGRLYAVKDGPPTLLDYREWLAGLGTVAMAFNPETRLLYIGDGTTGYVYNVDTGSFGKGPATVTGAGIQDGTLYVVASGTMIIPNFAITTDIRDFGTRKAKTIRYLEAAVDTTLTLEGSIDYRLEKQGAFASLDWYSFDTRGHCYLNCYGYEFRLKVRATSGGWFHLDRLSAFGVTHAH